MAKPPHHHFRRRLTPVQELRLFYSPFKAKATRRQVLRGLVVGAATAGCGVAGQNDTEDADSAGAAGDVGSADTGAGAQMPMGEASAAGQATAGSGMTNAGDSVASSEPIPGEGSAEVDATDDAANDLAADDTAANASDDSVSDDSTSDDSASEEGTDDSTPEASDIESLEPEPVADSDDPLEPATAAKVGAYDIVELGNTGIKVSRLAMGSGTVGYDGSSNQRRMGDAFVDLLLQGYERGVRFFETADAYGTHQQMGEAIKQMGRQNATLLTKTTAETADKCQRDLDRFMEELQTDYIDIVLLHIRTSPNWVEESMGAMEVLSEAKRAGRIRAHGVSCHSLEALQLAAATDWVDVDLARINPYASKMDVRQADQVQTVKDILQGMKDAGKGVIGMKILGEGEIVDRFDAAIEHAAKLDCVHCFTIGFTSVDELDGVANKIASVYRG